MEYDSLIQAAKLNQGRTIANDEEETVGTNVAEILVKMSRTEPACRLPAVGKYSAAKQLWVVSA